MENEKSLAIREDKAVTGAEVIYELETRFAMAVRQRELLENYIKERLKKDKHFYTVDGDPERKPSLTKEGAELICLPHALKPRYSWLFGPETPPLDDSPYQITMNCEMESNGKFAGGGVGSASSMITKKDGERIQRQRDPGLRHNATLKMACKSAYIAATLNSTAASEFFTQDMEDDRTGYSSKKEQKENWCKEHQTVFFMKGKMKAYAHPIKDAEGNQVLDDVGKAVWCHEPKEEIDKRGEFKKEGRDIAEEEINKAIAKPEAPEQPPKEGIKTEILIDLEWLKESLDKIQWTTVGKWLTEHYKVTGRKVSEMVKMLTPEQQREFVEEVKKRLEMS